MDMKYVQAAVEGVELMRGINKPKLVCDCMLIAVM